MTVANFDLNYLSFFLIDLEILVPIFFKTTPTFAIRINRRSQKNRNKVGTQLWDTLKFAVFYWIWTNYLS